MRKLKGAPNMLDIVHEKTVVSYKYHFNDTDVEISLSVRGFGPPTDSSIDLPPFSSVQNLLGLSHFGTMIRHAHRTPRKGQKTATPSH